jgi:aspartate kinase
MVSAQRKLLDRTRDLLDVYEVPAQITENCSIVSVIATSFRERPGMMRTVAETLADAGVAILQTADSEYSVSCLIHDSDMANAVRSLHDRFGLGS